MNIFIITISAKLDCLLKTIAELKADASLNKELLLSIKRTLVVDDTDVAIDNFKTVESLEELQTFEDKLKCEEEFAKAVCCFKFYVLIILQNV